MNADDVQAECLFLDVGQGSSQIIDLGNGSAVVIDCGRSPGTPCAVLQALGIARLASLILTHNDLDHAGGVQGVVRNFRGCIDSVWLLQDRPAKELLARSFYGFLIEEFGRGAIPEPRRLERTSEPCWLFSHGSDTGASVRIELLFPTFAQSLIGQSDTPNATSAVLLLSCGNKRILYPGDAGIETWRHVRSRRTGPIECDVLAVPHHGGQIVRHPRSGETYGQMHDAILPSLGWLYAEVIRADFAIVSVGTCNPYPDPHPLPCHVQALRDATQAVLCTQITERCCDDLERLRPGVLPPILPGNSRTRRSITESGKSRDVACAGTILIQLGTDCLVIDRFEEHQDAIGSKLVGTSSHPLCKLRSGKRGDFDASV